jgi:hypothetical protein
MSLSHPSLLFDQNETIGMAGNQVLEWTDLDSEIKTAGLKSVSTSFSATPRISPKHRINRIP